jgi:hypothetical protein
MRFVDRILQMITRPAPSILDPVFGEMTWHLGSWVAYVSFPHAREPVEVSVWGKEVPSAFQQAVFQKLLQRYAEIEPSIEQALFDEFELALGSDDSMDVDDRYFADEYRPQSTGEVWRIAHPVSIDVYPAGFSPEYDCRIYYAFPVDREHNRSLFLWDGKLVLVAPE